MTTNALFPTIFVGHGSPMNAIEDNPYSRTWIELGKSLAKPQAILCISAHWQAPGVRITAMSQPRTIYDFYGFPPELYQASYPAPGSPELASQVQELLADYHALPDQEWGLDHGTWSVLLRMFPQADIPVVQLSLDYTKTAAEHYALGQALRPLRQQGVLILGSGNLVHNLRLARWQEDALDWAIEFDNLVKEHILAQNHAPLIDYPSLGQSAHLSIPTDEHYLPLLYVLALQEPGEAISFFNEQVTMGSISMRGVQIG
jgi:4,5-DOPA dioxygenase extradiol